MINKIENVKKFIQPGQTVLDVGGGADPFPDADAVIDILPYESYSFGKNDKKKNRFSQDTWYVGDICSPDVWSQLPDKAFDFVICSHTLEDVRDPIYVCSQLQRIASAGYIETPSLFRECAKASADDVSTGWEHHRWTLEVENSTLFLKQKNPWINRFDYVGEQRRQYVFEYFNQFTGIYWKGSFNYAERVQKGHVVETENLFYFYEHYPYHRAKSFYEPPVFYTIENVPFSGKTLFLGHEYKLPVEHEFDIDQITAMHNERLLVVPQPPSKAPQTRLKRFWGKVTRNNKF